jgi:hypothetical protein
MRLIPDTVISTIGFKLRRLPSSVRSDGMISHHSCLWDTFGRELNGSFTGPELKSALPSRCGGISLDGEHWIWSRPTFLLPVRVLTRRFRRLSW